MSIIDSLFSSLNEKNKRLIKLIYDPVYSNLESKYNSFIAQEYVKKDIESILKSNFIGYGDNISNKLVDMDENKKLINYKKDLTLDLNKIPYVRKINSFYKVWFTDSLRMLNDLLVSNNFDSLKKSDYYLINKDNAVAFYSLIMNTPIDCMEPKDVIIEKISKNSDFKISNFIVDESINNNKTLLTINLGYPIIVQLFDKGITKEEFRNFTLLNMSKIIPQQLSKDAKINDFAGSAFLSSYMEINDFLENKLFNHDLIKNIQEKISEMKDYIIKTKHFDFVKLKIKELNFNIKGKSFDSLSDSLEEFKDQPGYADLKRTINDNYSFISWLCLEQIDKLYDMIIEALDNDIVEGF